LEIDYLQRCLEALSTGAGPRRVLISLGYSAWGQGQLESELAENGWLTVGADMSVIFDTPIEQRYERAMGLLGLASWMFPLRQVTHEQLACRWRSANVQSFLAFDFGIKRTGWPMAAACCARRKHKPPSTPKVTRAGP
jgi:hypothetical protein